MLKLENNLNSMNAFSFKLSKQTTNLIQVHNDTNYNITLFCAVCLDINVCTILVVEKCKLLSPNFCQIRCNPFLVIRGKSQLWLLDREKVEHCFGGPTIILDLLRDKLMQTISGRKSTSVMLDISFSWLFIHLRCCKNMLVCNNHLRLLI